MDITKMFQAVAESFTGDNGELRCPKDLGIAFNLCDADSGCDCSVCRAMAIAFRINAEIAKRSNVNGVAATC